MTTDKTWFSNCPGFESLIEGVFENLMWNIITVASQVTESTESAQQESSGVPVSSGAAVSGDSGSLETMSVVESLVKLGEKQPTETENGSTEETPEVFIALPCTQSVFIWEPLRLGIPTWILIQALLP